MRTTTWIGRWLTLGHGPLALTGNILRDWWSVWSQLCKTGTIDDARLGGLCTDVELEAVRSQTSICDPETGDTISRKAGSSCTLTCCRSDHTQCSSAPDNSAPRGIDDRGAIHDSSDVGIS
jgi:hypothetical protein